MKFKRILAVILSVLMLTSMASFTVSAEDAELLAEPILAYTTATNQGKLTNCERGIASIGYDAENDIVYTRVVPNFEIASGTDNSIYINMHGIPAVTPTTSNLYAVCYMRSNLSTSNATAGFYGGLQEETTNGSAGAYAGNNVWTKQMYTIAVNEDAINTASSTHFWIRPVGSNTVNTVEKINDVMTVTGKVMAEDAYYDVAGVALFDNEADAIAYDIPALSSGKITISFDAGEGEGEFEPYDVAAGKYAASNVVFPTTAPEAPEGMEFNGWSAVENGSPLTGDVAVPDVDTTYYACYKYTDSEDVDYDEIYLQNAYYKLVNDKNLTIGYLGGSVTVGTGSEPTGTASTTAWRALTTQWFKDNFTSATIKEVYAGIGGTGSRFASYRATRDLDLANNTLDLLFIDTCINDKYEGLSDTAELTENYSVIVAKALENNPKCQIVFVNVPDSGSVQSADDTVQAAAARAFCEANGFKFVDFKVAIARELTGNDEAVSVAKEVVDEKWSTYYPDIVHPNATGYAVYFNYLKNEILSQLVDENLTVSKAKYEDTAFDTEVDTNRYCGGTAGSNALAGLSTIKNYRLGQVNGFLGGSAITALVEGYSTTFKFTGTNAYIWANKHSHNALLDVYVNDNTNIGSPDNTIDMWRNQESGQSFMFPVLAEDLDVPAETTVTLVLRKNVDQETRNAAGTTANVGERLSNKINNIAIKGGTMDSVEFMASPEAFIVDVEYPDIVVPGDRLNLAVNPGNSMKYEVTEYDGKTVTKSCYDGLSGSGKFTVDGYHIGEFGSVIGEYYNYATVYMYVDDPEYKTAGLKPTVYLRASGARPTYEADVAVTPNAWQRISIDISKLDEVSTVEFDTVLQFHLRYFGDGTIASSVDGVNVYAEKLVFSAEDPGDWVESSLAGIKVNGEALADFAVDKYEYVVEIPEGITTVPEITAVPNVEGATITVTPASDLNGETVITVKGATQDEDVIYTISFKEAPAVQFKATVEAGAVEAMDETIYGTTGSAVTAPAAPAAKEHFTLKGWALEGDDTKTIVTDFGTFADEKKVYVAIYEEDAKATLTIIDGDEAIVTKTDYAGFGYTFESLDHTPTSRFVGYKLDGETEATAFAGDEIIVNADATYYVVRKEIKLEDAEYTFEGRYDYSDGKYVVEMYYVGPKANMTAFGMMYDKDVLTNLDVEYSDELQSTGTNKIDSAENALYVDVVYPTEGASFGDDMKTPVLVATLTFDMADYIALDTEHAIVKILPVDEITGAFKNGEWQYIKHSEDFSLDIAANVYPIYFTELVDNDAVTVTVEGADADITTVTAPASAKMLQTIEFKAVTADGEEPALVSYYVDGVAMGELIAGDDGETYIIPAEKVLGDVVIEFTYGEPIPEVAITGIDVPEVGEEPDTTAKIPANVNYTLGNVTWEPEADEFDFDTAYTVKVEVTAEEGYAFSGKTVYTINGETATVKKLDKDTVEVSFTFEPTVKELGTITVEAGLVRDADGRAYANFGAISVIDETGAVVASYEETADDEALAAEFEVLAGNYTVEIAKNGYLTYTKEITVVYKKNTTVETDLVAGNLYAEGEDDGVIDLLDFVRLTKAFTAETDIEDADALEAYRATVDIDEDGVVTVFDLAHIKANIGE